MTCFHQQFVTVNPLLLLLFCAVHKLRDRFLFRFKLLRLFTMFSNLFRHGLRILLAFFLLLLLSFDSCVSCFWGIFFILIVFFLCQSDLMYVIQDKMLLSLCCVVFSFFFWYWVIVILPPADRLFSFVFNI